MDQLGRYVQAMELNSPCMNEAITQLQTALGFELPVDYVEFMLQSNGGEGPVGSRSYLALWEVESILSWNEEYGVNEFAPGLVLFGSDGGDTAYAFDPRSHRVEIVEVPFIGMELTQAVTVGQTFADFLKYLFSK